MTFCLHLGCFQMTSSGVNHRLLFGVGIVLADHLIMSLCSEILASEGM